MATLFDQLGAARLRELLGVFYDRVFADAMIGFLFAPYDKATLIEREFEYTARLLGATLPYQGRSMRVAHAHLPIFGGHFERRMELLRQVIREFDVPCAITTPWLAAHEALRAQITADTGSQCKDTSVSAPRVLVALGRRKPDPTQEG